MRLHFIGINGIGVSALARHYLSQNHQVTGSDLEPSEISRGLEKAGAKIFFGPNDKRVVNPNLKAKDRAKRPDLVIYSPAIQNQNAELKRAKQLKIKCQSYPQALGKLTKNYFTIAVCGTHGKGTTTAIISLILIKAGLDPTVIVGTKLKEFGDSNYRPGKSQYLVIEADEYKSSFLNYWPQIIVLTTIDRDHLDYFKNLSNIIKVFKKFIRHLPKKGYLVINKNDENTRKLISNFQLLLRPRAQDRGAISNQFSIINFQLSKSRDSKKLKKILKIPGEHILADALAALATARILKIPDKISFRALGEYRGAWRRFEITTAELRGTTRKIIIVSDYAHHPTEIEVTLKAVREKYPRKKISCVFQPHQYQRTYHLFKDFVRVLSQAPIDKLILIDIYSVAGRESPTIKKKVSSKKLALAISKIQNTKYKIQDIKTLYIPTLKETAPYLKKNLRSEEVLVVMGAGDIYQLPLLLTSPNLKGKMNNS
ncbi:MAG: UDP-N-acetylmuramate--L-alanine ligase [bacterium]|nr:UDP-N-acetylmuramate--L-alanine ligase [bacterium]